MDVGADLTLYALFCRDTDKNEMVVEERKEYLKNNTNALYGGWRSRINVIQPMSIDGITNSDNAFRIFKYLGDDSAIIDAYPHTYEHMLYRTCERCGTHLTPLNKSPYELCMTCNTDLEERQKEYKL